MAEENNREVTPSFSTDASRSRKKKGMSAAWLLLFIPLILALGLALFAVCRYGLNMIRAQKDDALLFGAPVGSCAAEQYACGDDAFSQMISETADL